MLIKSMLNANPFDLAREMDRLFESMMAPATVAPGGARAPAVFLPAARARLSVPALNLWEDEKNLYVEAELPGLTMDDLEVLATDDELTLKGQRRIPVPDNARALRRERGIGAFERTIGLPVGIDVERIEAKLTNGVLSITMPKAPAHQARRIEIRTTSAPSS